MNKLFIQSCMAAALVIGLTGCPATQNINTKPLDQLMTDSNTALTEGNTNKAMETLDTAAKENPTSAQPWVKRAQIYFDQGNYPASIQAADEGMKRDPKDKDAKALAVVASLRVAVQALRDMGKDSDLRGSKRSEAERLAQALRDTLNLDVLVPLEEKKKTKTTTHAKPRHHYSHHKSAKTVTNTTQSASTTTTTTSATSTVRAAASSGQSSSANPFGSLLK